MSIGTIIVIALVVIFFICSAKRNDREKREARQRNGSSPAKTADSNIFFSPDLDDIRAKADRSVDRIVAETDEAIRLCPGSDAYRLSETQTEVNCSLLNITEFTKISKSQYVAFDLETTGLDYKSDAIVEIGAVRVVNGAVVEEYRQMVNPGFSMPPAAINVNHITDDMLADQPRIHQVLPAFLSFVGDDVLAAHNAKFDLRFLSQACMANRFKAPTRYFDTMELSRYWPDAENRKLSSLLAAAGLENDNAHRALSDARAVADLISATNALRAASRKSKKSGGD